VMETVSFEKIDEVLDTPTTQIAKYALTLSIAGSTSSLVRKETLASAKKTIKAPGFRPGVIPPFMRASIQEFILTECLQTEIARAVDEAGLLPCEGDASAPEFVVPIKEMNKAFEPGKPFEFSLEVALMAKEAEGGAAAAEGASEGEVGVDAASAVDAGPASEGAATDAAVDVDAVADAGAAAEAAPAGGATPVAAAAEEAT